MDYRDLKFCFLLRQLGKKQELAPFWFQRALNIRGNPLQKMDLGKDIYLYPQQNHEISMIEFTGAKTAEDIEQILALQRRNLVVAITPEELAREGFVTVSHTYKVLWAMNQPYPHIIAKANGQVVGYALVMLKEFRSQVPELVGLFAKLDKLQYQKQNLVDIPYFVMGQVCIDKAYRGQGVFSGMYQQMRKQMSTHFELIVTSIATRNPRSLRAHRKVGFQVIEHFTDELDEWDVVAWNWEG